jgi:predicted HicB family RNase H-like nuclease
MNALTERKLLAFAVRPDFALTIRIAAAKQNVSQSQFIRQALERELERCQNSENSQGTGSNGKR